jgi:hypothetical protein
MTLRCDGPARLVPAWVLATLVLGLGAFGLVGPDVHAQQPKDKDKDKGKQPVKLGLHLHDKKHACQGYTLLAPANSTTTYLINMEGRVVKTWQADCKPGHSAYLLPNGNLLRAGAVVNPLMLVFGGAGGRIQEYSWDGELLWDYTLADDTHLGHHDICPLPNGNVLLLVWEQKTREEAIAAGRRPETVNKAGLVADSVVEIRPKGKTGGEIVWEWHAWDHLVQEFDKDKKHHDEVGKYPQRIDVNFGENTIGAMVARPEELKKLQALGYVGGTDRKPGPVSPDWLHLNAVAYNPDLDQIILSVHQFSEVWVIDHSTTTKEAASESGGKSGKGGGLLYRWGNPRAYRAGTVKDQKLFSQHNAHWIPKGYPGEGNVLIFNNGLRRPGGAHSSVDEIVPPRKGRDYVLDEGKAFGPDAPAWSYTAPKRPDFYSSFISGAHRLPDGNTFICSGANGTLFEVTPKKEIVWKYLNPVLGMPTPGSALVPKLGQLVPSRHHVGLELTPAQRKDLLALEKDVAGRLDKILTDEQKKKATGGEQTGQVVPAGVRARLKLTEAQEKEVAELQKDAEGKLDKLLDEKQRKQFEKLRTEKEKKGPPPVGPPGGFGPPGGGGIFRATRYPADYAGLRGRELPPGRTIEEMLAEAKKSKEK